MRKQNLFGQGLGFPPRVGADGRLVWSAGEEQVREAIRLVLLTEPGERLMREEFGGGLRRFLFEPNTVTTRHLIETEIGRALRRWEPRIAVDSVAVVPDPADPQAAIATVTYRLVASQTVERVSVAVALGG